MATALICGSAIISSTSVLAWAKPEIERTVADTRGVRFRFEANQRDCYLDGVRVFLGAPVLQFKKELWISKLDVIKTVAPLLKPEDHLVQLPAAACRRSDGRCSA
jgi:hypothetical protein